ERPRRHRRSQPLHALPAVRLPGRVLPAEAGVRRLPSAAGLPAVPAADLQRREPERLLRHVKKVRTLVV
uniref:Uncharacterized protein n=1 Tax=Aegilops tauschii subsp. strangulata TaxID=200361 RepID=A0A453BVF0_AEGTS